MMNVERLIPVHWSRASNLPRRRPLVKRLLDQGALSVVYGESNSGKTFFALDLAAHIARGIPWRDRRVTPSTVIYIACEGGVGIEERLEAYARHHGIDKAEVPFFVVPEPIDLCSDDTDVRLLTKRITDLMQPGSELPGDCLIIIDTLSRALAGGDENSSAAMGTLVRHCDALRIATDAHVLLIHHCGKATEKGARGHSLLRSAVDTEIEVKNLGEGDRVAKVMKQRDLPTGEEFHFRLAVVDLDPDEDGEPVSSCVAVPSDAPPPAVSSPKLSPNQQTMYGILHEAGAKGLTTEEWNARAREVGIGDRRKADLVDIRNALKSKDLIRQYGEIWVVTQ